ncbi:tetratricopeptide repeat protein [Arthrobacter sp. HLT1-21]
MRQEDDRQCSFRASIKHARFTDPDGLFNAANDLQKISKAEAVEVLYLLAIDAGVTDALLNYGTFLWDEGKLGPAIAPLKKAYEANDPHAAPTLGQIYLELDDAENAILWFQRAGDHPTVPVRLARAYRAQGNQRSALKVLIEAKDNNAEAAVELVLDGELSGHAAVALLQHHAARGSVDVLIPLANLYGEMGRTSEEIAVLRQAVGAGEPNAAHNLGLALWHSGYRQEGRALLKTAAHNGDRLARRALERLRRKHPRK